MLIDKYILRTETNWCGEDKEYLVVVLKGVDPESLLNFDVLADRVAYDNFSEFSGINGIAEEVYGKSEDELSQDELDYIADIESEYWWWTLEEFPNDSEDDWYELIYIQPEAKEYYSTEE